MMQGYVTGKQNGQVQASAPSFAPVRRGCNQQRAPASYEINSIETPPRRTRLFYVAPAIVALCPDIFHPTDSRSLSPFVAEFTGIFPATREPPRIARKLTNRDVFALLLQRIRSKYEGGRVPFDARKVYFSDRK